MSEKLFWRKSILSAFLLASLMISTTNLPAQDVLITSDIGGGSSAFVFKSSRKTPQRKAAFRATTSVKRTTSAKVATVRRVTKQSATVAKTSPKRKLSKIVDPVASQAEIASIKRKTPQEASVIFAGVGEYYLDKDQVDEAVNWFRESVGLDEKNSQAKFGLADALVRKGNQVLAREGYDLAKLIFAEALENNPSNAGALAGMAEIYASKDDVANAIASYEKALQSDGDLTELNAPLGVLYYQRGDVAKAEMFLQKAVTLDGDNAETQFFVGLIRLKQDRVAEALAAFKKSEKLDPKNPEVYYYLGEANDRLNNDKEALAAYEKAVALNPRYAEAWFDLGVAYFTRENYPKSIEAYKRAIAIMPNFGEAYVNIGDVYRLANDLDNSIASYRHALNTIKNDAELYSKLGLVAALRAREPGYQNYWKTATESFESAVASSPDNIGYSNLGWAYYNLAQVNQRDRDTASYKTNLLKAKTALVKADSLNPSPKILAAVNLNLGMTLIDFEDFAGAIAPLKKASELEKGWLPAINELGLAYRKTGDFDNAVKQFKRTIDLEPNFAAGYYNLAEAEFRRGNKKEARKHYDKLVSMGATVLAQTLVVATNGAITK